MLWMSAMGLLKARIGQCLIICSIVWGEWPQSQAGESFNPHLYKLSPHLPCPVRSLFKVTHSRRLSEKPGTWEHGSLISWWLSGFDRFHFDLQSLSPLNLFSMRLGHDKGFNPHYASKRRRHQQSEIRSVIQWTIWYLEGKSMRRRKDMTKQK